MTSATFTDASQGRGPPLQFFENPRMSIRPSGAPEMGIVLRCERRFLEARALISRINPQRKRTTCSGS